MEHFNNDEIKKLMIGKLNIHDMDKTNRGLIKSICFTIHLHDKVDGECADCEQFHCICEDVCQCGDSSDKERWLYKDTIKFDRSDDEVEDYHISKKIEDGERAKTLLIERVNKRKELATPSVEPEKKKEKKDDSHVIEITDK